MGALSVLSRGETVNGPKPRIIARGVFTVFCVLFGHRFRQIGCNWFYCYHCCQQVNTAGRC